ncbi:MAG: baseplate J/gp47 family protein [Muribaculaceae bacterium]|nr:baseplate J/gp47 family protein [Muribaculaceae bacterium]
MDAVQKEIVKELEALAASYTPEWNFDGENPDAGAALAMIFAEMFAGVRTRFLRLPEKHKRAFFDMCGLAPMPASPAYGYVVFGMPGDGAGGHNLPKGVKLSAKRGEWVCGYETKEAVCVTAARLVSAYLVDPGRDYIGKKKVDAPFRPFAAEEENLQEHSFYLCMGEELFVSAGATVSLTFDGQKGLALSALAQDAEYSVSCMAKEGFVEFENRRQENGILRMECVSAPAEGELFGARGYFLCFRCRKPWQGTPFTAEGIHVASRHGDIAPDLIWNLEGEQENFLLFPFGREPVPYGECYFASAEALGKAGARVTVSFVLDYEKIPFDNSVSVDRNWKPVMRRADFVPDPEYDITTASVVWEYYNGFGWSRLPVEQGENIFCGRGAGETVRMEFDCPSDAGLLEWQAAPTRYLRVRILRMNNLYKPKGTYLVPVMSHFRFCYDYGGECVSPGLVVSVNNCEERRYGRPGKNGGTLELFYGQDRREAALYLGFHRPLEGAPLRFLFLVEEGSSAGRLQFFYSGEKDFAALDAVDGTEGFKKSGVVTANMSGHKKACVCGESLYWLKLTAPGEENAGINGIYLNAASAVAQASFFGRVGNCPPGAVNRLDGAYGCVRHVTNPLPFSGGEDEEPLSGTLWRGSAGLAHGGRAVTTWDYETLAKEASRAVERVKCNPCCNGRGEHVPGSVALVLLLKQYRSGSMYFAGVRSVVMEYFKARMGAGLAALERLYIVEPLFIELDWEVSAVAGAERLYEVRSAVMDVHRRFLDPVTGNYDGRGWEIGVLPREAQSINALQKIPGLIYVRMLRLNAFRRVNGRRLQVPLGGRDKNAEDAGLLRLLRGFAVVQPGVCSVTVDTE